MRSKRKGAKSIMPSVHNERRSASRECRVIDSRDTYNVQPEPTGASTTLPTAIQTTTHTPDGGNGGVEISTCYYGKTSTPRGLPCRQRFMFHTERTYHSQTAKAKGGRNSAIYKKGKSATRQTVRIIMSGRSVSLTFTAATAAHSARNPGISSQATATQGNECLRICRQ